LFYHEIVGVVILELVLGGLFQFTHDGVVPGERENKGFVG
jgi:hypothetical protein